MRGVALALTVAVWASGCVALTADAPSVSSVLLLEGHRTGPVASFASNASSGARVFALQSPDNLSFLTRSTFSFGGSDAFFIAFLLTEDGGVVNATVLPYSTGAVGLHARAGPAAAEAPVGNEKQEDRWEEVHAVSWNHLKRAHLLVAWHGQQRPVAFEAIFLENTTLHEPALAQRADLRRLADSEDGIVAAAGAAVAAADASFVAGEARKQLVTFLFAPGHEGVVRFEDDIGTVSVELRPGAALAIVTTAGETRASARTVGHYASDFLLLSATFDADAIGRGVWRR